MPAELNGKYIRLLSLGTYQLTMVRPPRTLCTAADNKLEFFYCNLAKSAWIWNYLRTADHHGRQAILLESAPRCSQLATRRLSQLWRCNYLFPGRSTTLQAPLFIRCPTGTDPFWNRLCRNGLHRNRDGQRGKLFKNAISR